MTYGETKYFLKRHKYIFLVYLAKQNGFKMELIGRFKELKSMEKLLHSDKSELVAVYGRRRVGKTFFIRESLKNKIDFQFTGLFQSNLSEHMNMWAQTITKNTNNKLNIAQPKSWFEAFNQLEKLIENKRKTKRKKVIFLDEMPWMATNRSRFLTAFTAFWNNWASNRKDILVIICGSSASWMINKILKNKGGLHNRVTAKIPMFPFNLNETELFLKKKNIKLDQYGITQLYMVMGGIPFYLDQVNSGESATQNINRLCFTKEGLLNTEFNELFSSLFHNSDHHLKIVKALAQKRKGLSRDELINKTKLKSGGGFTEILDELIESGFVTMYIPFKRKKRDSLYKLTDAYSLFYLKYINTQRSGDSNNWDKIVQSSSWKSWSGLAFESLCMLHIEQIKKALKINYIETSTSTWQHTGTENMPGAQIDLLINRSDGIINLCEMKYTQNPYSITGDYAKKLKQKEASFNYYTKNKKPIYPTIITTYKLIDNKYASTIQNTIILDDLFAKID